MTKKDKDTKDTRICIRLTEAERHTLNQFKSTNHTKTSNIVRKALNQFILNN